jgi:hypothetical protein
MFWRLLIVLSLVLACLITVSALGKANVPSRQNNGALKSSEHTYGSQPQQQSTKSPLLEADRLDLVRLRRLRETPKLIACSLSAKWTMLNHVEGQYRCA